MKTLQNLSMQELMHPRNVAIIGASGDKSKWGGRLLHYMTKHHIDGQVFPINPKDQTLMGVQSYPSLSACPQPVDLAIILVPTSAVLSAVRECVSHDVSCAVVITSGFAEAGQVGQDLEDQVIKEANAGGLRLIGPNCMGLLNTYHNLAATTAVSMEYLDTLPRGPIGMASQSGALMGAMLARGIDMGVGFSTMVSLGNQADIDQNDIFQYLIEDSNTEIITLYIEAVKNPGRFVQLLQVAREIGKPVLIVKSGRTLAGERAVMSHTASLAGAWMSFEAICREHGAYLFNNIFDLLGGATSLQKGQRMVTSGVAVFSGSGGGGALLVDALDEMGMTLPKLKTKTNEALGQVLPATHRELPIDFGVINHAAPLDEKYGDAISTAIGHVMEDPSIGAGLVLMTTQPNMDMIASSVVNVSNHCNKPLLFVHGASTVGDIARKLLRKKGYGFVESPNDAISIISSLWRREQMMAPATATIQQSFPIPTNLGTGYLSEPKARELLESAGIPTSVWGVARSVEDAITVAATFTSPAVIKAVSKTLVHKSDIGAVKLNILGAENVRIACNNISKAVQKAGHELDGYLVTEMLDADAELILGIQRDPDFGPMIMVGAGGILVELLKDVQIAPAPLNAARAKILLDQLKCKPMLQGWRGRKPVNWDQLVDVLVRLSHLAIHCPDILELDINPLMIVNGNVVAADARAVLAET